MRKIGDLEITTLTHSCLLPHEFKVWFDITQMSQRKHHHIGVFVISLADFESRVSRVWLQGPL